MLTRPDASQVVAGPPIYLDTTNRVGVYGWSPHSGGVHHYRIGEPLRVLQAAGVNAFTGIELDDEILDQVDHVLVHNIHDEVNSAALQELVALDSHKVIFDIDDWMWAPDWATFRGHYTPAVVDRIYANVSAAHVVTTPSPVIAEHLAQFNRNVWVVPNTVPMWLLDHTMPARHRPTVGYQGSPSHARDAGTAGRQLGLFLRDNPDWGTHFYGHTGPVPADDHNGRMLYTGWVNTVETYWRGLSFDVGIGPLRDTPFNRAKSALRAVEYAALGIVACLPDLAPYRGWVEDGVTGRLIHTHETLRGVLNDIARNPTTRLAMAANARQRAARWTTEARITDWTTAWASQ